MAYIGAGHKPTERRPQPAIWSRRAHYLTAEHGRESAVLIDEEGRSLSARDAIQRWSKVELYHEVIFSPSIEEVRASAERFDGDDERAAQETALRLAREIASGRPFFVAIHWDSETAKVEKSRAQAERELREVDARHRRWGTLGTDYHQADRQRMEEALEKRLSMLSAMSERWHLHLVIRGPMRERLYGEHGKVQKAWDRLWEQRTETIQDWEQHLRFGALREQIRAIQRQQQVLSRERSEAIRSAKPSEKRELARQFEERMLDLVQQRFSAESLAMGARYAARGTVGCAEHLMEAQQAKNRREMALKRMRQRYESRGDSSDFKRGRGRSQTVGLARALDTVLLAAQLAPLPMDRSGLIAARLVAQTLVMVLREYNYRRR